MARAKTVSQNLSVLVGDNLATGLDQSDIIPLWNVTALDLDWVSPKKDVISYGTSIPTERVAADPQEVSLSIQYHLGKGGNDSLLGLFVAPPGEEVSALRYLLDKSKDEKNYFIFVAPEGQDSYGMSGASSDIAVIGIGNGFINSYSLEGAVGDFPTASVEIQALNIRGYTSGVNQVTPAINRTTNLEISGSTFTIPTILESSFDTGSIYDYNVLRPNDIMLDLTQAGGVFYNYTNPAVQNFKVNFNLNRKAISRAGSRFASAHEIQFPININFEVSMFAKDLQTGNLSTFLCQTGLYNASVRMNYPNCSGSGEFAFGFTLKNISLESQVWSNSIGGDPQLLTTRWIGQVGSSSDSTNGFFINGKYGIIPDSYLLQEDEFYFLLEDDSPIILE